MRVSWTKDVSEMAERAARQLAELLARKPAAAIALPTGNTPLGLYRRLAEMHAAGRLSCRQARFFNLDEFVCRSATDPQSYSAYLWKHLLYPLAIQPGQVRLLRGDAADPTVECSSFEQAIAAAGGLDLVILGLGVNGHVAFNEPGSDWDAATREVVLTEATRRAQHGWFAMESDVPRRGLTMGVQTIRAARAILLLASGPGKEAAMAATLRGKPDKDWPVTAILDHPGLTILADDRLNPQSRTGAAQARSVG